MVGVPTRDWAGLSQNLFFSSWACYIGTIRRSRFVKNVTFEATVFSPPTAAHANPVVPSCSGSLSHNLSLPPSKSGRGNVELETRTNCTEEIFTKELRKRSPPLDAVPSHPQIHPPGIINEMSHDL